MCVCLSQKSPINVQIIFDTLDLSLVSALAKGWRHQHTADDSGAPSGYT